MWLLLVPGLAFASLAAHFVRPESWFLVAASAALILLLAIPRRWAAHLARAALVLGAIEWLHTLAVIAGGRVSAEMPVTRVATILGTVALLTLASTLAFRHPTVRRHFGLPPLYTAPGQVDF